MDIKNVNSTLNVEKPVNKPMATSTKEIATKKAEASNAVETKITTKKDVVSDIELDAILENLASADSKITDVEKADEMIKKANANILSQRNEAVLSQANQSKDVVEKLTK